jgi:hypothetical protein
MPCTITTTPSATVLPRGNAEIAVQLQETGLDLHRFGPGHQRSGQLGEDGQAKRALSSWRKPCAWLTIYHLNLGKTSSVSASQGYGNVMAKVIAAPLSLVLALMVTGLWRSPATRAG